jgi:2-dehydro-3-deoxyphosphogluconate aldolase/(4S)-4-hydroxy-2-oxoglutarate aldolase
MTPDDVQRAIETEQIIAVVRLQSPDPRIAEALVDGGISIIEISLVCDPSLEVIRHWVRNIGRDVILGAGTVLNAEQAYFAIEAGAQFLVAPNLDENVHSIADAAGVLYVPGAFTPSEAARALSLNRDLIKLFPAASQGPNYVRDLLAPLPALRLLATGGINASNAFEFIQAGSAAVAVGSSVIHEGASLRAIRDNASRMRSILQQTAPVK